MNKVKITINDKLLEVPSDYTIMQAALKNGIEVPHICYLKDVSETASCRLCVVEIDGYTMLKNSCTVKVTDGMIIKTNTSRVKNTVKTNLELIAANHKFECWICPREHNCELLNLLRKFNIPNRIGEDKTYEKKKTIINITDSLIIDSSKCILCGRCIDACSHYAGTKVLDFNFRGFETYVGPALNHNMEDAGCIYCGKCIQACPVGAIKEKDDIDKAIDLIDNENYYTVVQVAPAVRAALGEEFGYKIGTNVEGKMYKALKDLGFDDVTDVNFAADVTIMEEGTEFINRFNKFINKEDVAFPMFTSCSPGWIRYIETYYPEFLPNLSSCKSPQQIQGALTKHYYSKLIGVSKEKIKVISIMPCIAKKSEANRPEMVFDDIRDVDLVLTTRELARMIKRSGIQFNDLEEYIPNSPLAKYTGAGVIFGASGGVMEAAIRTIKVLLEKDDRGTLDILETRGVDSPIKEIDIEINGVKLLVAIVHGAKHFKEMFDRIKKGDKQYAFVEFMGCTGGCVNGGGQPIVPSTKLQNIDVRKERAKALYILDKKSIIRRSFENPSVDDLYKKFLEHPGSHKSHELLHTSYVAKDKYSNL